jgi:hypothetical protein
MNRRREGAEGEGGLPFLRPQGEYGFEFARGGEGEGKGGVWGRRERGGFMKLMK